MVDNKVLIMSIVVMLLLATSSSAAPASVPSRTAHCGEGLNQTYLLYLPETGSPESVHALPAVVLLHGAGDQPGNMVEAWKAFAKKKKIVLLAPELPRDPKFEDLAPRVFRCVVEDAKQVASIDPQRVYLFGNSMGGYLAFDGAMFESQYFAAVAVHANRIAEEYTGIVAHAQRKTPIAIYIGDHDQFFSISAVGKTRDLLKKSGFPVHYVEMLDHDHNYYARADEINSDAWKFFLQNPMPAAKQ